MEFHGYVDETSKSIVYFELMGDDYCRTCPRSANIVANRSWSAYTHIGDSERQKSSAL